MTIAPLAKALGFELHLVATDVLEEWYRGPVNSAYMWPPGWYLTLYADGYIRLIHRLPPTPGVAHTPRQDQEPPNAPFPVGDENLEHTLRQLMIMYELTGEWS